MLRLLSLPHIPQQDIICLKEEEIWFTMAISIWAMWDLRPTVVILNHTEQSEGGALIQLLTTYKDFGEDW